ncbi:hypothetical protein N2152v2_010156 [Parachlorella kessleri]
MVEALGLWGLQGPLPWEACKQDLADAFQCGTLEEVQDLVNSLLLAECVYKAVGEGADAALACLNAFAQQFPTGLPTLTQVQFSRRRVPHRYLLGRSSGALYVCFMGTKELRDYVADANLLRHELWSQEQPGRGVPGLVAGATVHRGFLNRSQGIPIESLYLHAQEQGLRLVLCGHSLGGAVAALCMLRLLAVLPCPPPPTRLRCLGFGCPAIGSESLAEHVHSRGWDRYFYSYALPEDCVPKLFLFRPNPMAVVPPVASPAAAAVSSTRGGTASAPLAAVLPPSEGSVGSTAAAHAAAGARSGAGVASQERPTGEVSPSDQTAAGSGTGMANGGVGRLAWAAGTLAAVAQTARAGAAKLVPTYPTFVHFGNNLYLLPTRVSTYVPAASSTIATAGAAAAAAAAGAAALKAVETADAASAPAEAAQSQPLFASHRMFSYRARVVSICQHALTGRDSSIASLRAGGWRAWRLARFSRHAAQVAQHAQHAEITMAQLAPALTVQQARLLVPPIPPLPANLAPGVAASGHGSIEASSKGSSKGGMSVTAEARQGSSPGGEPGPSWRDRLLVLRRRPQADLATPEGAGGSTVPPAAPGPEAENTAAGNLGDLVQVRVEVWGAGLQTCTAAWLRFPSGARLEASRLENRAEQRLRQGLRATESADAAAGTAGWLANRALPWRRGDSTQSGGGRGSRGRSLTLDSRLPGSPVAGGAGGAADKAGLVLHFAVPLAALAQLQVPDAAAQHSTEPAAGSPSQQLQKLSLRLVTDFYTVTAPVDLSTRAVWVLGPDPGLCHAIYTALVAASRQQAAAAAGLGVVAMQQRGWLGPVRAAVPSAIAGLPGAAAGATSAVSGAAVSLGGAVGRGAQAAATRAVVVVRAAVGRQAPQATAAAAGELSAAKGPGKQGGPGPLLDASGDAGGADAAEQAAPEQPSQVKPVDLGWQLGRLKAAWTPALARPALAAATRAGHRLRRFMTDWSPLPAPPPPLPRALVQGVTLVNATQAALGAAHNGWQGGQSLAPAAGCSSSALLDRQNEAVRLLRLIATVVRRKGLQLGFTGDMELLLADLADAEVADEDLLLDRQLGAGARLKRRVSQASRSAQHRAALLQRWPALREAPQPDLLLLVVSHDLLPAFLFDPASSPYSLRQQPAGGGSDKQPGLQDIAAVPPALPRRLRAAATHALRLVVPGRGAVSSGPTQAQAEAAAAGVLSEVHRVVALAKAFGMAVLLAVSGPPTLLGPAARQRLAAAVGLDETLGAVVPLAVHQAPLAEPPGGDSNPAAASAAPAGGDNALGGGSGSSCTSSPQGLGPREQSQQALSPGGQSTPPHVGLLLAALYAHAAAMHEVGDRGHLRGSLHARL